MADPIETQADGAWDPSRYRNHGEEVAAIQAEQKPCSSCGQSAFNPKPCTACEYERRWTRVPKQLYCSDCVKPCTDCGEPACESHRREHGECLSCSGPTDAEMKSAGLLG